MYVYHTCNMYTYIHTYICIYVYMYICICMYVCMYVCMYYSCLTVHESKRKICTHALLYSVCKHAYMCIRMYVIHACSLPVLAVTCCQAKASVCTCVCVCVCVCVCALVRGHLVPTWARYISQFVHEDLKELILHALTKHTLLKIAYRLIEFHIISHAFRTLNLQSGFKKWTFSVTA
jgi:hypothetical protein